MYKYVAATCVVYENGRRYPLVVNDVWDADDPLVASRPDLFVDSPPKVHKSVVDAPVETATAAPGEKRVTKRAAKNG